MHPNWPNCEQKSPWTIKSVSESLPPSFQHLCQDVLMFIRVICVAPRNHKLFSCIICWCNEQLKRQFCHLVCSFVCLVGLWFVYYSSFSSYPVLKLNMFQGFLRYFSKVFQKCLKGLSKVFCMCSMFLPRTTIKPLFCMNVCIWVCVCKFF